MATIFLVVTTQRSGSTWLIDSLNSHPQIRAHGELFMPQGDGTPPFGDQSLQMFEGWAAARSLRARVALDPYLETLCRPQGQESAIGFKVMYDQILRWKRLLPALRHRGPRVVHLIRRNSLDLLISAELAAASGIFHTTAAESIRPRGVSLNTRTLVSRLRNHERQVDAHRHLLRRWKLPVHETFYEDLVTMSPPLTSVLSFLGVSQTAAICTPLHKIIRTSAEERVTNLSAVHAILSNTRFEHFLATPSKCFHHSPPPSAKASLGSAPQETAQDATT